MASDEYDDYCYECQGYGDDYGYDEEGNYVCLCNECYMNPWDYEDDD